MATCGVIDIQTNQLLNTIVAEPTDAPYDNTYLVEIPDGFYWDETTASVTKMIEAI
jgi:hypothetical protein